MNDPVAHNRNYSLHDLELTEQDRSEQQATIAQLRADLARERETVRRLRAELEAARKPGCSSERGSDEVVADNGDVFRARPCDEEDGCVAVEHWITRTEPEGFDKAVDDYAREMTGRPPRPPEGEVEDEPDHDIHLPRDVAQSIGRAIIEAAADAARAAEGGE